MQALAIRREGIEVDNLRRLGRQVRVLAFHLFECLVQLRPKAIVGSCANGHHHAGIGVAVAVAEAVGVHDGERHEVGVAVRECDARLDVGHQAAEGVEPVSGRAEEGERLHEAEAGLVDVEVGLPHLVDFASMFGQFVEEVLVLERIKTNLLDVNMEATLLAIVIGLQV